MGRKTISRAVLGAINYPTTIRAMDSSSSMLSCDHYSEDQAGEEEEEEEEETEEETDKAMVSQAPAREHRQVNWGYRMFDI